MAGPSKSLVLDPALQKYYERQSNRYKTFRWTPRAAWVNILFLGVFPAALGYAAYKTDGKYEMRGKRRGDTIAEF